MSQPVKELGETEDRDGALLSARGSRGGTWPPPPQAALEAEYGDCLRIARHYENFPVASRLLPKGSRPHLAAVYAFARGADDIADEPDPRMGTEPVAPEPAARLAALARWEAALDGDPPPGAESVFRALAATRRDCEIPDEPLRKLITAFRWDVERDGFPTWAELRHYADHSAAPIGRLVVAVAGGDEESIGEQCDDLCVALQYTNFWQDLSIDWPRGRLYLPEESWAKGGLHRTVLEERAGGLPLDPLRLPEGAASALRKALAEAVRHTEELYSRTRTLPGRSGRSLAPYLSAVWEGGHRILERVRDLGDRAFTVRPRLGWMERVELLWRAYRRRWGER